MRFRYLVATLVVAIVTPASVSDASGWYNMPTSIEQCLGVGFGPGYHAPLLLGRACKAKIASQRVVRLPAPFSPPTATFGGASCLGDACGFGPAAPGGPSLAPSAPTGHAHGGRASWSPAPPSFGHGMIGPPTDGYPSEVIPALPAGW